MALAGQQQIGPYRLLKIIMTGQTSQVWSAINDQTQERVAMKILLSDYRRDREHLGFMRNEYEVGRTLKHERVVRIHAHGVWQGIPYLAMDFFPFPNMKEIIIRIRDNPDFAAAVVPMLPTIIQGAAEGLAYFNDQGWVHRDVKPDNFLVNEAGEVKLIDFALAVRKKSGLARLFTMKSRKLQGTRSYMSPEQIRRQPLDIQSDVYSFGCTLFHLLTGTLPYTGVTSNELLSRHLRAAIPSAEAVNRRVTPEFAGLVQMMMSKKSSARIASMHDFLRQFKAIKLFKQGSDTSGVVAKRK